MHLAGQVVADHIGGRQYSRIGGHTDFRAGTAFSASGRSLVCLPSTARPGGDETVSRIVARLPAGAIVTTPRHEVDVVVTEYGAAELAGCTAAERAAALRAIAHQDEREARREQHATGGGGA